MIFEEQHNNNPFRKGISGAVLTFIIGLLLVVIPYETIKDMIFVILGLGIILMNGIPCFIYWMAYDKNRDKTVLIPAILSTISIVIGIVFIFWRSWIISVILGVWLIGLPIIRIVMAEAKLERLKKEIPYLFIAVFLFFTPFDTIFNIVIIVFGSIIMVLSALQILYATLWNRRMDKQMEQQGYDDSNDDHTPPSGGQRVIIDAEVKDIE